MSSGPSWVKEAIARGNEFHYRKQSPLWHNLRNIGLFSAIVAVCAVAFAGARFWASWGYVPLASALLGLCFFTLIILVIHEASHDMFVIRTDRKRARPWNRAFGWMASIPFAINYARHWEEGHQTHHLHPLEPDDPQDEQNGFTGAPLGWMIVKMLFVPGYVMRWNPSRQYHTHRFRVPAAVAFWVLVLAAAVWFVGDARPIVMLVSALGVVGALNQLKTSMEHGGAIAHEPDRNFRSRTSLFPLRSVLMPLNISLHFEHHLNYCVPWYLLPSYHRALRPIVPPALWPVFWNTRVLDQLRGRFDGVPADARLTDARDADVA